jgi:hypothetical protein
MLNSSADVPYVINVLSLDPELFDESANVWKSASDNLVVSVYELETALPIDENEET